MGDFNALFIYFIVCLVCLELSTPASAACIKFASRDYTRSADLTTPACNFRKFTVPHYGGMIG